MASPEHQPARPGAVPDRPRRPSAHGRRVVHLPDVRLRPRPVRRDRGRHALDLHARVRGPPAALRLAHRATCRCRRARASTSSPGSTSPTRSSPSASCCASSTRATCAAGTTRGCPRSPGLRRRGFPAEGIRDFADDDRRGQGRQRRRGRPARARRPRRAEPHGAAPLRGPRPAQGGHRELPRGPGRGDGRSSTTRRTRRPGRRKVPFTRELWIERDDFMEEPPPKFFRLAPGREVRLRSRLLRHLPRGRQGRRRARSSSCAAPTTRRRAAATRPTAAGRRRRSTGSRPRTRCRPRSGSTTTSSRRPDPGRGRRPLRGPEPGVGDGAHAAASWSRRLAETAGRRDRPVRAAGLLLRPTPTPRPGHPVFNRTLTLKDTWAKLQAQGRQDA